MKFTLTYFIFFSNALLSFAVGPETVIISNHFKNDYYSIAPHAVIIEDKLHTFTFGQIKNNDNNIQQNFNLVKENDANLSFTTSSYWVKFVIKNIDTVSNEFLLEAARPVTNVVNLFTVYNNGNVVAFNNGDGIPFNKRIIKHRKILFPVHFAPKEKLTFYLQLRSDGEVLQLPIKLWHPEALMKKDYGEQYMFGIYYGILIFVIIIYFFFYIALREKSFLFYVLYVFSIMMLQMSLDGLSYQFLWPNMVWWGNHIVVMGAAFTQVFALTYAKSFLKLKKILPRFNRLFNIFIALSLICLFFTFFNGYLYTISFPFVNILSLFSIFLILVTIVVSKRKHEHVSLFFALGFLTLITGVIIFILSNINAIPGNFLTENAMKFGTSVEIIFLSLSMANKYGEIQQEKEKAQAESLKVAEENERLIREQNTILEQKVTERTFEVVKQKAIIEQKNKDILDSIYYARRIQHALLASDGILNRNLDQHFVLYKPKDIVSGDFYWAHETNNNFLIAVCDCTGHGVPGAFMSLLNISFLNEVTVEKRITKPDLILDHVRDSIIHALNTEQNEESRDGMDCVICNFDMKNLNIEFACSNNPLWIIRSNELIEFKPDKMPVGNHTDNSKPFTLQSFKLQKGDIIYIFSDGYADQFGGPLGKKFKYSQLEILLISIHNKPMNEQKEILNETIGSWKGELEQVDDICIIGIRI
jgi:serine phosphatase RsbU (regulator of sigma subunit)